MMVMMSVLVVASSSYTSHLPLIHLSDNSGYVCSMLSTPLQHTSQRCMRFHFDEMRRKLPSKRFDGFATQFYKDHFTPLPRSAQCGETDHSTTSTTSALCISHLYGSSTLYVLTV